MIGGHLTMSEALRRIWADIHEPWRWPPPPERPLQPVTFADLAGMLPTEADLARWGWRVDGGPEVAADPPPVKGRAA
jgi:hypothetical protein